MSCVLPSTTVAVSGASARSAPRRIRRSLRCHSNPNVQEGVGKVFKVEVKDNVAKPIKAGSEGLTFSDWLINNGPDVFTMMPLPLGCALIKTGEEPGAGVYSMDIKPIDLNLPGININVAPRISVAISTSENGLVLESRDATLVGSLDLTERMDFYIRTELTPVGSEVQSVTTIRILADPPRPLDMLPTEALTQAGNVTTGAALKFIHGFMLDTIISDYTQWASSADFRRSRSNALMQGSLIPTLTT